MKYKIPLTEPSIRNKELEHVVEAVRSGWISSKGKFVTEFEEKFEKYVEVKHGVATSSGTTALHLALVTLGIGPGDEVIIPVLAFAAVANAVIYTSAEPVFVDSHPNYWCIDPKRIEEKITKRTKAIMLVHLYGHPCDMDAVMKIAKAHDLYVIEDCAEAHGAEYKGRKAGSFGDIACFSFYGNKIITTGEGGMCLTNDEELAEKMRILRDHGMKTGKQYWHEVVGFNYRMTNLQAALGVAQLEKIDEFVQKKRQIARQYETHLKGIEGLKLQPEMDWAKNVYWLYSILVDGHYGLNKDELQSKLEESGIETRRFFYPIHQMPPYKKYSASKDSYPIAEKLSKTGLNLPGSVKLTEKEVLTISKLIRRYLT